MKNEPPLDIVLVTFESLEQSSKVYHSFHYNYKWSNCFAKSDESDLLKPQKWRESYAPPPWDIYWENLTNFEAIWWFKIIVFHVVVLMFVVLVTTPQHLAHHFNDFIHTALGKLVHILVNTMKLDALAGPKKSKHLFLDGIENPLHEVTHIGLEPSQIFCF